MDEVFTFRSSSLGDDVALVAFRGHERLSAPFRFDVFASVPAADAAPADAIGLRATLSLRTTAAGGHDIHGVVAAFDLMEEVGERVLVRLVVAPRLWQLGLTRHSRIFTGKSTPDIVRAVLEESGLSGDDYELRLEGNYPEHEHVCQYRESDLDFVSRWMEHEGLYYFFEHDEVDRIVITDHRSFHGRTPERAIRYRPSVGHDGSAGECFERFLCRHRLQTSRVRLVDHDYARPELELSGKVEVAGGPLAEVVEHGARFFGPDEGARLAALRAEELRVGKSLHEASGAVSGLRAGHRFELEEHPRTARNREYLCVALEHRGSLRATTPELRRLVGAPDDRVYCAQVTAIPADVQFRAPLRTPWPRVAGTELALIDGPAESEYAQLDADGRYHVKFAFDESALREGKASTAVRMMQPHAGSPEGFHFPLRKGTEVVVSFLGGDPDRPLITGTAPTAHHPSPVTATNHTRNMLRTGGNNVLEVEDLEGKQWVDFRTPSKNTYLHLGEPYNPSHYIVLHTAGDCLFRIGTNQDIRVGGNLDERVEEQVYETYLTSQTSDVTGPQATLVHGPVEEHYQGGHSTTTTGHVTEQYGSGQTTTVSGGLRTERYTSGQTTIVTGGVQQVYASGQSLLQTGGSKQDYQGTLSSAATGGATLQFDGRVDLKFGPTTAIHASAKWGIPGAADVFASTWKLTMTNAAFYANAVNELKTNKTEGIGVEIGVYGVKAEAIGVAVGGAGLKLETSGLALDVFGLKVEVTGVNLGVAGSNVEDAAGSGK